MSDPKRDSIFESFLKKQQQDCLQLAAESDQLQIEPFALPHSVENREVPSAYIAGFQCNGLVRNPNGEIEPFHGPFVVGIQFPDDYLRQVDPANVVCWLGPKNVFHPNIRSPQICLGRMPPGTGIVDICYQVHEIICFKRWTPHDPLNETAAQWARQNAGRFPTDDRPLRRSVGFQVHNEN